MAIPRGARTTGPFDRLRSREPPGRLQIVLLFAQIESCHTAERETVLKIDWKKLKRTVYKLHKWIAVGIGFFIIWMAISGSIWVLPFPAPATRLKPPKANLQFSQEMKSPAEIDALLRQAYSDEIRIRYMHLVNLAGRMAYEMKMNGRFMRVDAQSGEEIVTDLQLAQALVESHYSFGAPPLASVTVVKAHDLWYPYGDLPAYRFNFDHKHHFMSHYTLSNGEIRHSDRYTRIRDLITATHDLSVIKLLINHNLFYRIVLIMLGMVTICAALTGYYLSLPRRITLPKKKK